MNAIAIVDQRWAIGRRGGLLFSLPGDMKHFRELTLNGTVIMGRKTLDSFPGGRSLPQRRNIVITRDPDFHRAGCEIVHSPEEAVLLAGDGDDVWLIGGGSVYAKLLHLCRRVYLTKVCAAAESADTFFPDLDFLPDWFLKDVGPDQTENGLTYHFMEYENMDF